MEYELLLMQSCYFNFEDLNIELGDLPLGSATIFTFSSLLVWLIHVNDEEQKLFSSYVFCVSSSLTSQDSNTLCLFRSNLIPKALPQVPTIDISTSSGAFTLLPGSSIVGVTNVRVSGHNYQKNRCFDSNIDSLVKSTCISPHWSRRQFFRLK